MSTRKIKVKHLSGAPDSVISAIRTEGELKRLIEGKGDVDLTQLGAVVNKIQAVIADYLESGESLQIELKATEVVSALQAAIQEADGSPSPWPDGADARTFFVHGLYDEIIQQPSNIFETKLFPDGSTRYVPIGRAIWKACLERVRDRILEAQ